VEYAQKINIYNWETKIVDDKLYFYILSFGEILSIKNSIVIDNNLVAHVYLKRNKLSSSDLSWIPTHTRPKRMATS
jgi:hypothetical protein